MLNLAILEFYAGPCGKVGYYNNQAVGLARTLVKEICSSVLIVIPEKKRLETEIMSIEDNIKILYVPTFAIGSHAIFNLRILDRYNIDIVQINAENALYAPIAIHYCERHKLPYYIYLGYLFSNSKSQLRKFIKDLFTKYVLIPLYKKEKLFAKTPRLAKELMSEARIEGTLMPPGLDIHIIPDIQYTKQELRIHLNLPSEKKIILFVGRLTEEKHPLESLKLIEELDNNFYLILVGTGELQNRVLEKIKEISTDKIKYIEQIPNEQIHAYYRACDYFVNYSTNEIFGMSILEAMYQGCSVIARHAPGPDFIIENKKSGYLVKSNEEMKDIMLKMYDPSIGENAKKRILDHFIWDQTSKRLIQYLKSQK